MNTDKNNTPLIPSRSRSLGGDVAVQALYNGTKWPLPMVRGNLLRQG